MFWSNTSIVRIAGLSLALILGIVAKVQANIALEDNEYLVFYHHDALGSPAATTDEKGRLISRETSMPYGKSADRQGESGGKLAETQAAENETRLGYTGHSYDGGSQLVYMKARFYDPAIGRFYSNDPVGFNLGNISMFNRYAYANNNPYRYVDPDGRNIISAFGGAFSETWEGISGRGDGEANYSKLGGALLDGYNGEGAGFWASAGQDALELGGAAVGGAVLGKIVTKIASRFKKAADNISGYRAVSKAEADDIANTGSFRADPNGGSMESKWFSESKSGADKIKNDHADLDTVVEADVPRDVYDRSFKADNIDSSGPGFCVSCDDLHRITPR